MTRIKVFRRSTGHGILLDAAQAKQFQDELLRVTPNAEATDSNFLALVGPDCEITITEDGQPPKNYRIFGRSVLVDVNAKTMTQFYMGLLVLEWLHR